MGWLTPRSSAERHARMIERQRRDLEAAARKVLTQITRENRYLASDIQGDLVLGVWLQFRRRGRSNETCTVLLTTEMLVVLEGRPGGIIRRASLISLADIVGAVDFTTNTFGVVVVGDISHPYSASLGDRTSAPVQTVVFTEGQGQHVTRLLLSALADRGIRIVEVERQFPYSDRERVWHWYNDYHVEVMIEVLSADDKTLADVARYVALRERKRNGFKPFLTPAEEDDLESMRHRFD
jgi:hypothetical protein